MKSMKTWHAASVACECVAACVMLWGCAYVPSAPPGEPAGAARLSPTAEQFERRQRERARMAERQGRLAEAEMASAQPRGKVRSNDLELASMLAAQGELDDAIAVLEARLAVDKRDAAARSLLAEVYYQRADRLAVSDRAGAIAHGLSLIHI